MKQKLPSIRMLVSAMVLAPVLLAGMASLMIFDYGSSRIEAQLSTNLAGAATAVVTREINSLIRNAEWVSDLYAYRVRSGILPVTPEFEPWDRLMIGSLSNGSIASLAYALPDGRCVMVMDVGGELIASHSDGNGPDQTREYRATPQGTVTGSPIRVYHYDVTRRPWYRLGMASATPTWTPVYAWFDQSRHLRSDPPIASLGYTRRLEGPDSSPAGVLSVDVSLGVVERVLRESEPAVEGALALLDEQDRVLCSAGGLKIETQARVEGASGLPHINTVPGEDARIIREQLARLGPGNTERVQATADGKYISIEPIRPFEGVNWRLVAVVPEQVINGETQALRRAMVVAGVICTLVAIGLGFALTHRITVSTRRMLASVRRIGQGDFDVTFEPALTREFAEITAALADMTHKLKEQVALRAAKEAAESANRAKSAFFARATHELRTPLSAIIGYAELVEEYECVRNDPEVHDDIRRVLQASRQLLGVINSVLDLARIEAGKLTVVLADTDVPALLREVVEMAEPLAQRNNNRLRLEIGPGVGTMCTDAGKLKQILLNLLANSARFTNSGTITLLAECDNVQLHLAVQDTGSGIPADKMDKLFEPFYQADARRGGTGLGLSITRQLTQALGGVIELRSVVDQGTTAHLYFPIDPPSISSPELTSEPVRTSPPTTAVESAGASAESVRENGSMADKNEGILS